MGDELKTWLGVNPLSLEQATFLALGVAPTSVIEKPIGFSALLTQMQREVLFGNVIAWRAPTKTWDGQFATRFEPKQDSIEDALVYRDALAHWLTTKGITSAFFHLPPSEWPAEDGERSKETWPWGGYTTSNLELLAEAAKKFWRNYDPHDHSTAPLNDQVVRWLESRGVSSRIAKAMATILRADNLPPGPRA